MNVPLSDLDQHSLASLRQAFREAPEPSLDLLVGQPAVVVHYPADAPFGLLLEEC